MIRVLLLLGLVTGEAWASGFGHIDRNRIG